MKTDTELLILKCWKCGKEFQQHDPRQKYCSDACADAKRQREYRARLRVVIEAGRKALEKKRGRSRS